MINSNNNNNNNNNNHTAPCQRENTNNITIYIKGVVIIVGTFSTNNIYVNEIITINTRTTPPANACPNHVILPQDQVVQPP